MIVINQDHDSILTTITNNVDNNVTLKTLHNIPVDDLADLRYKQDILYTNQQKKLPNLIFNIVRFDPTIPDELRSKYQPNIIKTAVKKDQHITSTELTSTQPSQEEMLKLKYIQQKAIHSVPASHNFAYDDSKHFSLPLSKNLVPSQLISTRKKEITNAENKNNDFWDNSSSDLVD